MTDLEKRLFVFAKGLETADDGIDAYRDGALERAIKHAIQDVKQTIGDQLLEVLTVSKPNLENWVEDAKKQ